MEEMIRENGLFSWFDNCVFKNDVKRYRKLRGLTQTKLASLCNVSQNTISDLERGNYNPSSKLALALCFILDVRFEQLFYYELISDFPWYPNNTKQLFDSYLKN